MTNLVFFGVLTLAIVVAVIIFVVVMLDLRRAIISFKVFLDTTESEVKPTLVELQKSLKSVRNLTETAVEVAEDVKVFSESVRQVGEDVKSISKGVKETSHAVKDLTSSTMVEASGLKEGIKAGVGFLFKSLFRKRQEFHER